MVQSDTDTHEASGSLVIIGPIIVPHFHCLDTVRFRPQEHLVFPGEDYDNRTMAKLEIDLLP